MSVCLSTSAYKIIAGSLPIPVLKPISGNIWGWVWLVAALCLVGSRPLLAASLTVAAAADISAAESDLTSAFHKAYPRDTIRFVFAASGALAQQIANGAPYDVFLSANGSFVDQLASNRKLVPGTATVYALGQLGILWRDAKPHPFSDLTSNLVRFVAMANPKLAPYGLAAEQALEHEELWGKLTPRIVFGENVRQALQMFDSGNADVVLTSYSLMSHRPGAGIVPAEWHQPIRQKAGVVAASANQELGRKFLAFLQSPQGGQILTKHGLTPSK